MALAVRVAIATMFTGAAMVEEDKTDPGKALQFALEMREQMTAVPAREPQIIRIDPAVIVLPFSAYTYAIGLTNHLGHDEKCAALQEGLKEAISTGKQGESAKTVDAWVRLTAARVLRASTAGKVRSV